MLAKYKTRSRPRTVLVVDDDDIVRERLRRMLVDEGWEVTEAENGLIALARLAERQLGLILLDLIMPDMDGFEFLAEIRHDARFQNIPVIIVTAADLTDADRHRLNGGVERIVEKAAYSREELLAELRKILTQHAATGEGGVA